MKLFIYITPYLELHMSFNKPPAGSYLKIWDVFLEELEAIAHQIVFEAAEKVGVSLEDLRGLAKYGDKWWLLQIDPAQLLVSEKIQLYKPSIKSTHWNAILTIGGESLMFTDNLAILAYLKAKLERERIYAIKEEENTSGLR